jgi:hypothetical protein
MAAEVTAASRNIWRSGNGDRLTNLQQFAAAQGKSPSDFQTQLDFANWELNNTESATGKALQGVTDPVKAAAIAAGYERPQGWKAGGDPSLINGWGNRRGYAVDAFNRFGGAGSPPAAVPPAAADATGSIPPAGDPRAAGQVASLNPAIGMPAPVPQPAAPMPGPQGAPVPGGGASLSPQDMATLTQRFNAPAPQASPQTALAPPGVGVPAPTASPAPAPPMPAVTSQMTGAPQTQTPAAPPAYSPPNRGGVLPPDQMGVGASPQAKVAQVLAARQDGAPQGDASPKGRAVASALAARGADQSPLGKNGNVRGLIGLAMDPWAPAASRGVIDAMLQQRLGPQFGFQTLPDGTILRTDPRAGTVSPVYQAPVKKGFEQLNGHLYATDPIAGSAIDATPNLPAGYRPATDQERTAYGVAAGIPLVIGPDGKPTAMGPQTVVNNQNGENAFDKTIGEGQGKMFLGMAEDGPAAQADLGRIGALRQNLAKLPGGFLGGAQQIANSWGLKIGQNAGNVEAANAILSQLVPAQRQGMPGAASDRDVQMFRDALPKLSNTPEGNALILDTMQGLAEQRQKQAQIATAVTTGQMSRQDGMKAMQGLPDPFAALRKSLGSGDQGGSNPTPLDIDPSRHGMASPPAPASASTSTSTVIRRGMPMPQTDAEFQALPKGALYVDPDDNKIYRK